MAKVEDAIELLSQLEFPVGYPDKATIYFRRQNDGDLYACALNSGFLCKRHDVPKLIKWLQDMTTEQNNG